MTCHLGMTCQIGKSQQTVLLQCLGIFCHLQRIGQLELVEKYLKLLYLNCWYVITQYFHYSLKMLSIIFKKKYQHNCPTIVYSLITLNAWNYCYIQNIYTAISTKERHQLKVGCIIPIILLWTTTIMF